VSGNPGGRPKSLAWAARDLPDARAPDGGPGADVLAQFRIDTLLDERADLKTRMDASRLLADRGWGKAPAHVVESDRGDGAPVQRESWRPLTPARALALARVMVGLDDQRLAALGG
jgi:hypothetical protein